MTYYAIFASPIGQLTVSTDGRAITGLHIAGDRYFSGPPVSWILDPDQPLLGQAGAQLHEYFVGRRRRFSLPVAPSGTPFQRRVWQALKDIPSGQTATYRQIAEAIGQPTAARSVGTAIGRNPICLLIPCHRVRASNGGPGGYVAGLECKERLLALEHGSAT